MKGSKKERREARQHAENVEHKAPLGSGERFKALEESAKASGARDPAAVAAAEGRKKYGEEKMAQMSKAGKKK